MLKFEESKHEKYKIIFPQVYATTQPQHSGKPPRKVSRPGFDQFVKSLSRQDKVIRLRFLCGT